MEIMYRKEGDYLIPNLDYGEEPEETLTKYGLLRQRFLKEHHHGIYTGKLLSGTLKEHCLTVQKQAEERAERMIRKMMQSEGVTEELKDKDQMEWVHRMNQIRSIADEIVLGEIIYSL